MLKNVDMYIYIYLSYVKWITKIHKTLPYIDNNTHVKG